jgi:hypothetical protein
LTLIAVWFLVEETHRGQQWTPALTLPQVRYSSSREIRVEKVLFREEGNPTMVCDIYTYFCSTFYERALPCELSNCAFPRTPCPP